MKINIKIKYIKIADDTKLYLVDKISFYDFTVIAKETDLTVDDVPAEEVFDITDFRDFKVKLQNWHGNVVNFADCSSTFTLNFSVSIHTRTISSPI